MINKILVAVDGSVNTSKAVQTAVYIAEPAGAEIHLLYVIQREHDLDGLDEFIRAEKIKGSPSEFYYETMSTQIIENARQDAFRYGARNIKTKIREGDPVTEIINYASDYPFDLVIMGGYGLGHISSRICSEVTTSCMIVRKTLLDGKRVLVVDDEVDILESLEELLYMCTVEKAASFEEAEKLLNSRDYDIVILDIMGVNGYSLLEIANEKPVITAMLTARALSMDDTIKSYKEGAASYIPKDKIVDIAMYLTDLLEAKQKGKHFWWRWSRRFGSYFEKKFGKSPIDEN